VPISKKVEGWNKEYSTGLKNSVHDGKATMWRSPPAIVVGLLSARARLFRAKGGHRSVSSWPPAAFVEPGSSMNGRFPWILSEASFILLPLISLISIE